MKRKLDENYIKLSKTCSCWIFWDIGKVVFYVDTSKSNKIPPEWLCPVLCNSVEIHGEFRETPIRNLIAGPNMELWLLANHLENKWNMAKAGLITSRKN